MEELPTQVHVALCIVPRPRVDCMVAALTNPVRVALVSVQRSTVATAAVPCALSKPHRTRRPAAEVSLTEPLVPAPAQLPPPVLNVLHNKR